MMNDERYVRKGYKIWDTYSDKEVQELNYRSQSDDMCEILNEKESRINTLVKENEQLKEENKYLKKRIKVISDELYCKDKKLEELGVPIECCDKKMSEKRLKFTLESDRQYIGIFDEGYALTGFEVCNLLNSLYQQCEALQDENEQLSKEHQEMLEKYILLRLKIGEVLNDE